MLGSQLIREARLRAGLTQGELGEKAGVAQSAVARWESGRVRPSLDRVAGIVAATGLELQVGITAGDSDDLALIQQQLRLTPTERLRQLVRTVRFIEAGRREIRDE